MVKISKSTLSAIVTELNHGNPISDVYFHVFGEADAERIYGLLNDFGKQVFQGQLDKVKVKNPLTENRYVDKPREKNNGRKRKSKLSGKSANNRKYIKTSTVENMGNIQLIGIKRKVQHNNASPTNKSKKKRSGLNLTDHALELSREPVCCPYCMQRVSKLELFNHIMVDCEKFKGLNSDDRICFVGLTGRLPVQNDKSAPFGPRSAFWADK